MNWDWYSATLPTGADEALAVFERAYGLWSVQAGRGLYSYTRGAEVRKGSDLIARAFWGGVNGDDVHVQASGPATPSVVQLIREHWPEHRVSRGDSREDWSHPKAWRWVTKIVLSVAEQWGLQTSTVGDWIQAKKGRTLYVGGRTSRVQLRVYEKGKQLGVDPNWVRLEVQVRPTGEGKGELCRAEPAQLMSAARWTSQIAEMIGIPELAAVRIRDPWTPSDDARALDFCMRQYGRVMARKAAELGGWQELGLFLRDGVDGANVKH